MTMHVIRDDAPGHDVTATESGWSCQCGAGNQWTERPRVRAVAAGKRHLAAIARDGNGRKPKPDVEPETEAPAAIPAAAVNPLADPNPVPEPAPWETPADAPAPAPAPAPVSLVDQFRSPPRDAE